VCKTGNLYSAYIHGCGPLMLMWGVCDDCYHKDLVGILPALLDPRSRLHRQWAHLGTNRY